MNIRQNKLREQMLAKRHAKAIFELAKQEGIIDQVLAEIRVFEKYWNEISVLRALLSDKNVPLEKKKRLIESIFTSFALLDLIKNFLLLLADKDLLYLLSIIVAEYAKIKESYEKIIQVSAEVVAEKYASETKQKIEEILSQSFERRVVCQVKVNPAILAGIVVRFGDHVYDDSVLGKLKLMQDSLV